MATPNSEVHYGEMIQSAMQGAADMSQVTVAVAIGLFGILALFMMIKTTPGFVADGCWWAKEACANDSSKMLAYPLNPTQPLEGYSCKECKREITIDNIVDAFVKVESAIEQELNV